MLLMTPAEIRAALADRVLAEVSARTGIHRNTLAAIRSGRVTDPSWRVVETLSLYLRSLPTGDAQ